ncbi:hypothetical protein AVEN_159336-1 [Araneus ventricosus]|uniref:Uncharacterized protein n=1 Tax=Araneus ventricosus TaxID=182803 RepID=A0A4Y2A0M5_ARAVE|nr:hypothetical protein AVEN_159336-1 [Araneus ventricosus]
MRIPTRRIRANHGYFTDTLMSQRGYFERGLVVLNRETMLKAAHELVPKFQNSAFQLHEDVCSLKEDARRERPQIIGGSSVETVLELTILRFQCQVSKTMTDRPPFIDVVFVLLQQIISNAMMDFV